MEELKVTFGEWEYHFDALSGYWVCDADGTTMSTATLLRWIKHDTDLECSRVTSNDR